MYRFKKCDRCDRDIPLGNAQYKIRVEVTSDFDGFLPEDVEEAVSQEQETHSLLEEIENLTASELEADVHLEMEMTLCKPCRDRFLEELDRYSDHANTIRDKAQVNLH